MAPAAQLNPESIRPISAGPFSGSAFVGGPGGASIDQYDTATGALIKSWSVAGGNGTGGTDWVDLELDGHTLLYDGEGSIIRSFDLATDTQGPDFATVPPDVFALRVIPGGAFKGDVLAAEALTPFYWTHGINHQDIHASRERRDRRIAGFGSQRNRFLDRRHRKRQYLAAQHRHRRDRSAVEHREPEFPWGQRLRRDSGRRPHGSGAIHLGHDASRFRGPRLRGMAAARRTRDHVRRVGAAGRGPHPCPGAFRFAGGAGGRPACCPPDQSTKRNISQRREAYSALAMERRLWRGLRSFPRLSH